MTATGGKNISKNTDAVLSAGITINPNTSTTILAAQAAGAADRIKIVITNDGNFDAWIKLQPASADDDQKGIKIYKKSTETIMENADIYTGEISAISDLSDTEIFVTNY